MPGFGRGRNNVLLVHPCIVPCGPRYHLDNKLDFAKRSFLEQNDRTQENFQTTRQAHPESAMQFFLATLLHPNAGRSWKNAIIFDTCLSRGLVCFRGPQSSFSFGFWGRESLRACGFRRKGMREESGGTILQPHIRVLALQHLRNAAVLGILVTLSGNLPHYRTRT